MRIDPEQSSPWMIEFQKNHLRNRSVLLYGNVADQFLLNGEFCNLWGFLKAYFTEMGYQLVGRYDPVDRLRWASPGMQADFDRIVLAAAGGTPPLPDPAPAPPPPAPSPSPGALPPRSRPNAAGTRSALQLATAADAVAAFREALGQEKVSAAIVLEFFDQLVGDPDRQPTQDERSLLVRLRKTVQEAGILREGPLRGRRNALVAVAQQLGRIPAWFHRDNHAIALVAVSRPIRTERKTFILQFGRNFHGGKDLDLLNEPKIVEDFVDLTEGLSAWDLEALRRTSQIEGIPIRSTRQLVDYFRHGRRDDPWEKFDAAKIEHAEEVLSTRVKGQLPAIRSVVQMLYAAKVGISLAPGTVGRTGRPKGVFFFVGPTGVGKTDLAKALTELIFGDETAFARFDMSEYAQEHAAEKLVGAPPGFVGYEEGGQLTNHVRERPFTVLLFDEIEKAHPKVLDKFLQILEDGRLTDGKGQTAYFSQTVIIFTSNLGAGALDLERVAAGEYTYEQVREHFLSSVRAHFIEKLGRPELLNRLGQNILVFDVLRPENVDGICSKFLEILVRSAEEKGRLTLRFAGDEIHRFVHARMREGHNLAMGGRQIKTILEAEIERPLNSWVFRNNPPPGATVRAGVDVAGQVVFSRES